MECMEGPERLNHFFLMAMNVAVQQHIFLCRWSMPQDFLTKVDPSSTFLLFILSCSCKTSQYRMGRFYSLICLIRSAALEKSLPVRPHTLQRLCRDWNTFCICSPAVDMRDGIRLKKPLPLCPIAALEALLFVRA